METEKVEVRWTVSQDGEITGSISYDPKGRRKIALIQNYQSSNRSTFEGLLPEDGEKWECTVAFDTIPSRVYEAWEKGDGGIPYNEFNKVSPSIEKYVKKHGRWKNPAYVGALVVNLVSGGNLTLKEIEEARKYKADQVRRAEENERAAQQREAVRKQAEEDTKKTYPGYEILDLFFPRLAYGDFKVLYTACTLVSQNKIFHAIRSGRENGFKGYHTGLRELAIWPQNLTVTKGSSPTDFKVQTNGLSAHFSCTEDGRKIFTAIYAWVTREENATQFIREKGRNVFICTSCSEDTVLKKNLIQAAMGSDQRIQCNHCGKAGTVKT